MKKWLVIVGLLICAPLYADETPKVGCCGVQNIRDEFQFVKDKLDPIKGKIGRAHV